MTITSYIQRGNSSPIILEDKSRKYFVKLRAGMSGKQALVAEWIGNKLADQLNVKTQTPTWIELHDPTVFEDIHIEVKDLIAKSSGINIGFEYQEDATSIHKNELDNLNRNLANKIYLFDLMMINVDRTPDNLNLMKVGTEIISVDYESSLLIQSIIEDKNLLDDSRILHCLRSNPLYQEMDEATINTFIEETAKINMEEILKEIPLTLLNDDERILLISGIETKKKNKWFLKEILNRLKEISIETKEESKRRMKLNQQRFKQNFKEANKG